MVLAFFIRFRKDMPFVPLFWLFAIFIVSCGASHLIEATIFWRPWYRLSGLLKAVTAVVSWATVIQLINVLPAALALPSVAKVNLQLREEIAERKQAEAALRVRTNELEALLDALPAFVWISRDAECRVIIGNRMANELMGVEAEANVSQSGAAAGEAPCLQYFKEDGTEYPTPELPLQRVTATGEVVRDAVLDFQFTDGRRVRAVGHAVPLMDEQGSIRGGVAAFVDISARRVAEEEKEQALRLLDTLLSRAPVGFAYFDRNLRFVRVNEQLAAMNGLSIEAHIGRTVGEIVPALETPARKIAEHILATGDAVRGHEFSGETPLATGVTRYWSESWYPVNDEAGKIVGFGAVVEDITERRESEARLRLTNERFDLAVKCSQVVLFQQDLELRYTWNHNQWLGFDNSDLIGKRDADLMERAEDAAVTERLKREVIRTGAGVGQEVMIHIQGLDRYYDLLVEPLRDHAGMVSGVTCAAIEITSRKQAEEARRQSQKRVLLASEAARIGIWSWLPEKDVVIWENEYPYRILGIDPSSPPVTADGFVTRFLHPGDRSAFEGAVARTVQAQEQFLFECRILRPDGEVRWVEFAGRPEPAGLGGDLRIIGTIRDVTARKNAERAILEEGQRKDEFLAMLGHELRNPLNAIRHAVQIAHDTPESLEASQWSAQVIDRQSQQLSRMVDDLLDVARISRGRIELRPENLDIATVLERATAVVQPLMLQRQQTFTTDIATGMQVTGDSARLEQVIVNLLNNASKYTPEGGRISMRARMEDCHAVITIVDNGVGIDADLLPHVFDLFRQAQRSLDRSLGGLGIGLKVVKSLVELHRGRVTIESAGAHAGATVTVRLPLLELPAATRPSVPPPKASAALPKKVRVLIVDDHEDAARSLARLLRLRGCEVVLAHTGPNGLTAAREFFPEVLLLDIGLPGFDGYELARILRADTKFSNALFIAISGYAQDGDRARSLASGFDRHFGKPINFSHIMDALHLYCARDAPPEDPEAKMS
ncbi:MAG: luxQ 6 [Verrucomicrobiales bacterium]|nr:luxQ 6 [Verrucomicrobiales bacterium]